MKELTKKLLDDKDFINAIDHVVNGAMKKEFNSLLADPDWRFRIVKLVLLKELHDDNLANFIHAMALNLDEKNLSSISSILAAEFKYETPVKDNNKEDVRECDEEEDDEEELEEEEDEDEEITFDEALRLLRHLFEG